MKQCIPSGHADRRSVRRVWLLTKAVHTLPTNVKVATGQPASLSRLRCPSSFSVDRINTEVRRAHHHPPRTGCPGNGSASQYTCRSEIIPGTCSRRRREARGTAAVEIFAFELCRSVAAKMTIPRPTSPAPFIFWAGYRRRRWWRGATAGHRRGRPAGKTTES